MVPSFKELKRVSNTAQLPNKSDQVARSWNGIVHVQWLDLAYLKNLTWQNRKGVINWMAE